MPEEYVWYRRLAAVPGVNYASRSDIDRAKLPDADAEPKIQMYRSPVEGQPHKSVIWGDTGQSPAAGHGVGYEGGRRLRTEAELKQQLTRVYEALELPGSASDYHYILMTACELIWSNRILAPWALNEVESLDLLDIQLIEAHPRDPGQDVDMRGVHQPAFGQLVMMYQREGYLLEAAEIAERGSQFRRSHPQNPEDSDRDEFYAKQAAEIRARIAATEERDGG